MASILFRIRLSIIPLCLSIIPVCLGCYRMPKNVQVFEGGTAEFSCEVDNRSDSTNVVWSIHDPALNENYTFAGRPSRDIYLPDAYPPQQHGTYSLTHRLEHSAQGKTREQGDTHIYGLRVEDVTPSDGQFKFACSLWDQTGPTLHGDLVNLTVWSVPRLQCALSPVIMPDVIPENGIIVELHCSMIGADSPLVPLAWYSNGRQLAPPENGTNLLLFRLTSKDVGREFRCVAGIETSLEVPSCTILPLPYVAVAPTTQSATTVTTKSATTKSVTKLVTAYMSAFTSQATNKYTGNFNSQTISKHTTDSINGRAFPGHTTDNFKTTSTSTSNDSANETDTQHQSLSVLTLIIIIVACAIVLLLVISVCFGICNAKGYCNVCSIRSNKKEKQHHQKDPLNKMYQLELRVGDSMYEPIGGRLPSNKTVESSLSPVPLLSSDLVYDYAITDDHAKFHHRKSEYNYYEDIKTNELCKDGLSDAPVRASVCNDYTPVPHSMYLPLDQTSRGSGSTSSYTPLKTTNNMPTAVNIQQELNAKLARRNENEQELYENV